MIRRAIVEGHDVSAKVVAKYLPGRYDVVEVTDSYVVIEGEDYCGWTLESIIERLATGLWWAKEIDNA